MTAAPFITLIAACAPHVDAGTAQAIVAVESGFNPFAIGVVGGALGRQPRARPEALATMKALQGQGWDFSIGLAQINVHNLARLGLSVEGALDPCANLTAMQTILTDCFARAQQHQGSSQRWLRQALSCYYSGNFVTGFQDGYVSRVAHAATLMKNKTTQPDHTAKEPL